VSRRWFLCNETFTVGFKVGLTKPVRHRVRDS